MAVGTLRLDYGHTGDLQLDTEISSLKKTELSASLLNVF